MLVSALIFVLFVWTVILYFVLIPFFANRNTTSPEEKMMNDSSTFTAYMFYFIGILLFQIIQGIVQVLPCSGSQLALRITYVILLTGACWSIFAIVLFSRELMRMPFANTFGYFYVSKKLQDALQVLIPKNLTNTNVLIDTLKTHSLHPYVSSSLNSENEKNVDKEFLSEMMKNVLTKTHIDDNYELSTYIRSGTNFIKSLKYINDFTTTIFDSPFIKNINQIYMELTKEKKNKMNLSENKDLYQDEDEEFKDDDNYEDDDEDENKDRTKKKIQINLLFPLVNLLEVVYTRDIVGEFLLFFLVGVMCIVLTLYLVQKTACSSKTVSQINQEVSQYEAEQQAESQPINQSVIYS